MRRQVLMLLLVGLLGAGGTRAFCDVIFGVTDGPTLVYRNFRGLIVRAGPITGVETSLSSLTYDGSTMWSIEYGDLSDVTFKIDPETGAGTAVGETGYGNEYDWAYQSIENNPQTGVLYLAAVDYEGQLMLYTIDKITGAANFVVPISGDARLGFVSGLAIDRNGNAYVTDFDSELFHLDLITGQVAYIGSMGILDPISDLAFDQSDQLWGVSDAGDVYTIDTNANVMFQYHTVRTWIAIAFAPAPPLHARPPFCLKWQAFCDGLQINAPGIGGAQWYHFDCANNSPMDVSPNRNWTSACGTNGTRLVRSTAGNGPGAYYFVLDTPLDSTLDMHQGTYPNGTCWIPDLAYTLQLGTCTDLNGQAIRSSIQ